MRATLVAAGAALALAGCGLPSSEEVPRAQPALSSAKEPPVLPRVTPFTVAADEPARPVKKAAVAYLEALFNNPPGGGTPTAKQARDLLGDSTASALQVIYPQLGGLTKDKASIMAVVRLTLLRGEKLTTSTRTLDVRLSKRDGRWLVSGLASTGVGATRAPRANALVTKVLASRQITLPDSARWDLRAGLVDDRVLRMLIRLSRDHRLSVTVLSTGHPLKVFGSPSVSNHRRGRAVDIWAIDGRRVAAYAGEPANGQNPARALMDTALRYGSDEIGGPWSFAGRYGATFTNTVHQDHLHLGFKR